ncbi:MAG TPA: helicase HerA-like domain-containing protein [Clostridia bacterium]|nr:helicase HerA-like domain-containing protein [Clostridia bacterium]
MYSENKLWIAKGDKPVYLLPGMANRHGLIAGATGTGKTVTLKVMAESFSDMGVPVFLTDIKGDLAGLAAQGSDSPELKERITKLGIEGFVCKSYPVCFWDLFGEGGHRVRTTVSELGALLLSRLLGLNETQTGIVNIIFRIADDKGLLLLDLKDFSAMLKYVGDHAKEYTLEYGSISTQSVGAILRSLIAVEDQGGANFFGEPALDISDWMRTDGDGRGYINILHSIELLHSPALYSTFLLWMLSELFETLPEVGDMDRPKLVFFFGEAHLLFEDTPKVLLQKIEQAVRLIRSKGVGVYFITQDPADLPQDVLGQLGNRVQHALRAYTPAEQKSVRAAARTFRANPDFDTETAITKLETGEALVSCLDSNGSPGIVERAFILPPQSQLGTIDADLRSRIMEASPMGSKYGREVDRESAYELLQAKVRQEEAAEQQEKERLDRQKQLKEEEKERREGAPDRRTYSRKSVLEKTADTVISTIGRELGRTIIRGILGSLKNKWNGL